MYSKTRGRKIDSKNDATYDSSPTDSAALINHFATIKLKNMHAPLERYDKNFPMFLSA